MNRAAFGCAFVLVLSMWAPRADACSCDSSGPPCQNAFQVDAVFIGTVQGISEIEGTAESPYRRRLVTFTTPRVFRGRQGTTTQVMTGMDSGDCGYTFKRGMTYLVYAYQPPKGGTLTTGICSRTRPIEEASEDLQDPGIAAAFRAWWTRLRHSHALGA